MFVELAKHNDPNHQLSESLILFFSRKGQKSDESEFITKFAGIIVNIFSYMYCQKQLPEVSCKKGVLRNFAKFTWKYLSQSLLFKVASLIPFLQCTAGQLLLYCFSSN